MSYQQFPGQPGSPQQSPYGAPPAGPAPYVQQPAAPFTPAPAKGPRRTGLIVAGIVLIVTGVVGGGALMYVGGKNYEDAVNDLARAPIGCTTSLDFDTTGTFTVFIETEGEVANVGGSCATLGEEYSRDDVPDPLPTLQLTDGDGEEITIDDDDSKDYDVGGFAGESIGRIEIDEPGDYELTVSSDEDDFAIAIGKDPKQNATLATVGLIVLIVGLVVGLILLVLGLRRRPVPPGAGEMGAPPGFGGQPVYAPTIQQPATYPAAYPPAQPPMNPPASYPPSQPVPPGYSQPPTAPMPVTPPPAPPGSWSPPPQP